MLEILIIDVTEIKAIKIAQALNLELDKITIFTDSNLAYQALFKTTAKQVYIFKDMANLNALDFITKASKDLLMNRFQFHLIIEEDTKTYDLYQTLGFGSIVVRND